MRAPVWAKRPMQKTILTVAAAAALMTVAPAPSALADELQPAWGGLQTSDGSQYTLTQPPAGPQPVGKPDFEAYCATFGMHAAKTVENFAGMRIEAHEDDTPDAKSWRCSLLTTPPYGNYSIPVYVMNDINVDDACGFGAGLVARSAGSLTLTLGNAGGLKMRQLGAT